MVLLLLLNEEDVDRTNVHLKIVQGQKMSRVRHRVAVLPAKVFNLASKSRLVRWEMP